MKKLLVSILLFMALTGCTGLNVSTVANVAADTAFVLAVQNHRDHKAEIIAGLYEIKSLLANDLTYDQLIAAIAMKYGGDYAVFGVILSNYLNEDKPLSETYLSMFDDYKMGIVKKINYWLLLAESL